MMRLIGLNIGGSHYGLSRANDHRSARVNEQKTEGYTHLRYSGGLHTWFDVEPFHTNQFDFSCV